MKEGFRRRNRQESPSLVNGGGFRSHSKTVRRFESCLLHHILKGGVVFAAAELDVRVG